MGRRRQANTLRLVLGFCHLVWRQSSVFLPVLLLTGGWYAYETQIARPAMVFQGLPQTTDWRQVSRWFRVLRNDGFILGYSDLRGDPLWVMYQLRPVTGQAPKLKRPRHFNADWRALNRVDHDSYSGGGYDRGHMAPNYAMGQLYGASAQADSFLMTNIAPQKANLNQKWWQRLESVEIDHFARQFGQVWVITGPVFDDHIERLKSAWQVEIPDAFYKIYLAQPEPGKLAALAFLVPQTVHGKEPLDEYLTTIDNIEAQTGLDFFPELDDAVEAPLEASKEATVWQLEAVARLPSRY